MKFDLCVGNNETFLVFYSMEDRDQAFDSLEASYGWKSDWADKTGDLSITLHSDKIPIAYRWKCQFVSR